MQYYDLLSSEQRDRILTEQLLDRMEEAEEIENSRPTGYARHDDDDDEYYEEQRRREKEREREREESERQRHRPYGHRFRSNKERRNVGYGRRRDNDDDRQDTESNKKPCHKSYACRSAHRNHNKPHRPYAKGRPNYKSRRPPK